MNVPPTAKEQVAFAKVELLKAEAEGQRIDNRTAEALAVTAEISANREVKTAEWESVSNSRQREYHLTSGIDPDSVSQAIDTLTRWNRIDQGNNTPYKFVICSPGGAVVHGMKLYSTLKAIAAVRPLVTVASGLCASMATIIHQAGTLRVIEPGCSYLIHDVSGESFGSIGNMQDTMDWMTKLNTALHRALAEKAKISLAEVAELGKRRDGWFMPDEIIAFGLADVVGYALDAHHDMPIPEITVVVEAPVVKPVRVRKVKST